MRPAILGPALVLVFAAQATAATSIREARDEVAALQAQLLARDSATETLQSWCADHRLADPPTIVAHRLVGHDKPADADVRRLLGAGPGEPVRYRRVALACGDRVLSNADNWYRPAALTAAMNAELDGTDHPFGLVVKPLNFHRERLAATVLVSARDKRLPAAVIRHEALLETPDGVAFSLVVETYTRAVADGGPAKPSR